MTGHAVVLALQRPAPCDLRRTMSADDDTVELSKYLSWVLRHEPAAIGLVLDAGGWVGVDALIQAAAADGTSLSTERIAEIVATSDKQRFALSEDGRRIRAQQGHSVEVELNHAVAQPPAALFHGTVEAFVPSIREHGLRKGARHHVHLSADEDTARRVGSRRGRPVLLQVRAAAMAADGHTFFLSPNGVWLTETVPPQYLVFPAEAAEPEST